MHLPPLALGDPGARALRRVKPPQAGVYIPERGKTQVEVSRARNPNRRGSFGYVDRFVRVGKGGDDFPPGTLVVPLDGARLRDVATETLRLFRWDDEQGAFQLVYRSGLGQTGDYLWAALTEPGLYGVIGVPTDPLVARTLAIMASLEDLLELDGGRAFLPKICQLILCAGELRERMEDPDFARAFVEDNARLGLPIRWPPPSPHPGGGGQGVCETCLGGGARPGVVTGKPVKFPELQILPRLCVNTPPRVGRWDVVPVVPPPPDVVLAIHAALLRTGKVVFFGGSENVPTQHPLTGTLQIDNTRLWDPATAALEAVGSPPDHDLFCCGHALLPDGKLLAAGGTSAWGWAGGGFHGPHWGGERRSAVFDPGFAPGSNPWTATAPLNYERGTTNGGGGWYPTLVTLPDGRVLRMLGHPEKTDSRHINDMLETFDPVSGTWSDEGATADVPVDLSDEWPYYPRLHMLPDGQVFCVTPLDGPPADVSWKWNPATKAWTSLASGPGPGYEGYGTSTVLLPLLPSLGHRPRVLAVNRSQPRIIDLGATTPTWTNTSSRTLAGKPPRENATAVLLPDASVLVVGGNEDVPPGSPPGTLANPVLAAERYEPATGLWSTLASAAVPRVYHSVALLLPDGRVWTAGSDYGPTPGIHEPRMEVYSPPYLFRGPRPTIASAPATITVPATTPSSPATVDIACPQAPKIVSAALIRCGSSTHAVNSDQRYVGLQIQATTSTKLTVAVPPNGNVAPPGYYLLFVLDQYGVPSVGRFVRVG